MEDKYFRITMKDGNVIIAKVFLKRNEEISLTDTYSGVETVLKKTEILKTEECNINDIPIYE